MGLQSSNAPAWVQAVGSILAIGGTAWATLHQVRRQQELAAREAERVARERSVALLLAVIALNSAAVGFFTSAQSTCERVDKLGDLPESQRRRLLVGVEQVEARIAQLPIHELPAACVTPALGSSATISDVRAMIETELKIGAMADTGVPPRLAKELGLRAEHLQSDRAMFESALAALLR